MEVVLDREAFEHPPFCNGKVRLDLDRDRLGVTLSEEGVQILSGYLGNDRRPGPQWVDAPTLHAATGLQMFTWPALDRIYHTAIKQGKKPFDPPTARILAF